MQVVSAFLLMGAFTSAFAQPYGGSQLDTISNSGRLVKNALITSDGGCVLQLGTDGGIHLWKCNASGTPEWARSFAGGVTSGVGDRTALCADQNGGFFVLQQLGGNTSLPDEFGPVPFQLRLSHFDSDGTIEWERSLNVSLPGCLTLVVPYAVLDCAVDEQGSIFCSMNAQLGPSCAVAVVSKHHSDGVLEWSRMVGRAVLNEVDWPSFTASQPVHLVPTDDGGCALFSAQGPDQLAYGLMARLDESGELLWMRRLRYLNAIDVGYMHDVVLNDEQGLTVVGGIVTAGHHYHFTCSLHPDGSLRNGHFYEMDVSYTNGLLRGERAVNGHLLVQAHNAQLRLDTDGSVQEALFWHPEVVAQNNCMFEPVVLRGDGDAAFMAGDLNYVDSVFGYQQWKPAFWEMSMGTNLDCMLGTPNVTTIPIPDSLLSLTTDTAWVSLPVPMEVMTATSISGDRPILDVESVCDQFLAVPDRAFLPAFSLSHTLVEQGATVTVSSACAEEVHLLTMDGRDTGINLRCVPDQRARLSTVGLAAGSYIVIAQEIKGGGTTSLRLTVY